ncbi:hypothetical protein ACK3TF_002687 [Chlorella vulgaris]
MASTTGRDGGLPGSGTGATTAHTEGKGLAGLGFVDAQKPTDVAPSKEDAARFGDIDKASRNDITCLPAPSGIDKPAQSTSAARLQVAPNQPVTAAKQAMEEDRGQTYTSASGRPTEPSPTNMLSAACRAGQPRASPPLAQRQSVGRVPCRLQHTLVSARRTGRGDFDPNYVAFDDEEDWEERGTTVKGPGVGPVFSTALKGVSAITDKLVDVALQLAPADTSPGVVRVAVNATLVLVALSFVKSLLGFFLTLGTIFLGAYVAVKVFGVDVSGITSGAGIGGSGRPKQQQQKKKRRPDQRSRQSEFKGLLGGREESDGLMDVWFERKSDGSGSGRSRRK